MAAQAITPAAGPDSAVLHRQLASGLARHHAPVALHDQQLAVKAMGAQIAVQAFQVAAHHRLQGRVQAGRGGTLELADLGQHLGCGRDVRVRPDRTHRCHRRPLVGGIGVGVDEEHADGFTPLRQQRGRGLAHLLQVHRRVHAAVGQHTFVHLQPCIARDQRVKAAPQAPGLGPVAAAHLQHVAKTAGGDQPRAGNLALQQRVGAHRGAVDDGGEAGSVRRVGAVGGQHAGNAVHEAHRLFAPRGRHLDDVDPRAGFVEHEKVSEGATDVHAHHAAGALVVRGLAHDSSPPKRLT
jgi:hypothetical protein